MLYEQKLIQVEVYAFLLSAVKGEACQLFQIPKDLIDLT